MGNLKYHIKGGLIMNNQYISRYAKHDTHFLRTSDKNYYFEQDTNIAGKIITIILLIASLVSLAFLATL